MGEVESLFVDKANRSAGIGTVLVTRGLAWMDSCEVIRKRVSVGNGNESAWAFYRKFGFYPRMAMLEQKTGSDRCILSSIPGGCRKSLILAG